MISDNTSKLRRSRAERISSRQERESMIEEVQLPKDEEWMETAI